MGKAYDFPFTILDVLDKNGILYNRSNLKAELKLICPFCGGRSFYVNTKINTAHCFKCDWSGGTLKFEGDLNGYNEKEAYRVLTNKFYVPTMTDAQKKAELERRKKEIAASCIKQSALRPVAERHATYSSLANMLTLSEDHKRELEKRGLSSDVIAKNGYRTLPGEMLEEYSFSLLQDGKYLDGVPGFYRNEKGNWTMVHLKRGIMIPVRNHQGLIQGYQVRKDNALLKTFFKKDLTGSFVLDDNKNRIIERENKFNWLSSKNAAYGCGTPGLVHYATDFKSGKSVTRKTIFLTEGPLKGDIAHYISGKPFICVPGVSLQLALAEELSRLKLDYGVENVVVCYDMDYLTNENVREAVEKCYDLIYKSGLNPYRAIWNEKFKGIDDYLVSLH